MTYVDIVYNMKKQVFKSPGIPEALSWTDFVSASTAQLYIYIYIYIYIIAREKQQKLINRNNLNNNVITTRLD